MKTPRHSVSLRALRFLLFRFLWTNRKRHRMCENESPYASKTHHFFKIFRFSANAMSAMSVIFELS